MLKLWQNKDNNLELPAIIHQAGNKLLEETKAIYVDNNVEENNEIQVKSFIEDMPEAYGWADLVIARSGALTVAEVAAVGVASILIPLPYSIDDHQRHNALYLANEGGAILMSQAELTAEKLLTTLLDLNNNREKLIKIGEKAFALRDNNAADKVAEFCLE